MNKIENIQIEVLNEKQLVDVNGGNCPQRAGFMVGGMDGTSVKTTPEKPKKNDLTKGANR